MRAAKKFFWKRLRTLDTYHLTTAKIERGLGSEHARLCTFRARPNCLHNSLKCMFVCLFVCLFIFPQNQKSCLLGINLCISLNNIRSKQKLLVLPPPPRLVYTINTQRFVCLSVCLSVYFSAQMKTMHYWG